MSYSISALACPQDHYCPLIRVCPVDAISQNRSGLPVIDDEKCISCGKCQKYCPMQAVEIKNY